MSSRCRATLLLVALSASACGGKVSELDPTDGGIDAPSGRPDATPIGEVGVTCCPVGVPGCSGPLLGGSPPCGRRGPSDLADWDTKIDANGCTYLVPAPGGRSCFPPPKPDAGPEPGPPDHGMTTGRPCTDDTTCDVTGDGVNACSNALFTLGTLYPAPVCVGQACDPGTHDAPRTCDGDTGLCLETSAIGICLPRCSFDGAGGSPKGCVGLDVCNVYGWTKDASGVVQGVGYCFGGCRADADCTKGDLCQLESGLCVRARVPYSLSPGTACVPTAPAKCNCIYQAPSGGYCANVCRFGVDKCTPGFTCDAQLAIDAFATTPVGLAGNCLKNCASDAECAGLNAKCLQSAGTGQKTCQPGVPF